MQIQDLKTVADLYEKVEAIKRRAAIKGAVYTDADAALVVLERLALTLVSSTSPSE